MKIEMMKNQFGEALVFVWHQAADWPVLICGDDLTPNPIELRERPIWHGAAGTVAGFIFDEEETLWLSKCWDEFHCHPLNRKVHA